MSETPLLTLSFLERQPRSAALVLDRTGAEDAAAFLEDVPGRISAPTLGYMLPLAAARCLDHLSASRAANIVRHLPHQNAVSLLRIVQDSRREALFGELPGNLARALRRSLTYPADSVGAYMDHSTPAFPETTKARDALEFLKRPDNESEPYLFVIDASGRFSGLVNVLWILRAADDSPLHSLVDQSVEPLSNYATLMRAAESPGWVKYAVLPVVNRKGVVLGGLSREALFQALGSGQDAAGRRLGPRSFLLHMMAAYLTTSAELIRLSTQSAAMTHSPAPEEARRGHSRGTSR
ncbi:MAG: hypothetical protein R3316_06240 [Rhodovibrionaceae bacterium]|nr:hypothetical protein [Rhodovibrionaceae bacterium]